MKKLRLNKKGVIELQFNWIFILIAGGLILGLFMSLVGFQAKNANLIVYSNLLDNIRGTLAGARISTGTDYTIEMKDITLEIDCNFYKIKGSNLEGDRLSYWTYFGMKEQTGPNLYLASRAWMTPYAADYFLYITSDNVRYTVIRDQINFDLAEQVYEALPKNTTKELVANPIEIIDRNHGIERIITIKNPDIRVYDGKVKQLIKKNKQVSLINLKTLASLDSPGEFEYWELQKEGGWKKIKTGYYLDQPTLIGAIYSQHNLIRDEDLYECNLKKAFDRLTFVSTIYHNRTQNYATESSIQGYSYMQCNRYYSTNAIEEIILELEKNKLDTENLQAIRSNIVMLKSTNEALIGAGCAPIY